LCHYLAQQVVSCIKRGIDVIVIPVSINVLQFNPDGSAILKGSTGKINATAHSNILVYRRNHNHIEHVEPHGAYYQMEKSNLETRAIQQNISKFVEAINAQLRGDSLPTVKLVTTEEVCPSVGFQGAESRSSLPKDAIKEPHGYCAAWSMFFAELCLKNPEIPMKILQRNVLHYISKNNVITKNQDFADYLRLLIRGYAHVIAEKITENYSKQFGEEITVEKLISYYNNDSAKHEKVKSRVREMIDLEVNLFGAEIDLEGNLLMLKKQIKNTEQEIDEILAVKRPKNKKLEDMPRVFAKYTALTNKLDILNSQLSLYLGHIDLENIKHSSKTTASSLSSSKSKSSSKSISSRKQLRQSNSSSSRSSSSRSKRKTKKRKDDTLDLIDNLEV
jgi:pyrimidine operon attenuation protein/uracil phosphoribosyltransferase